jgi:hypothetical protein
MLPLYKKHWIDACVKIHLRNKSQSHGKLA